MVVSNGYDKSWGTCWMIRKLDKKQKPNKKACLGSAIEHFKQELLKFKVQERKA